MKRGIVNQLTLQTPWVQNLIPHLPKAASVLLIVLIALSLAQMTWRLATPGAPTTQANARSTASAPTRQAQIDHARRIADAHLFGLANAPAANSAIAAPDTKLNLTLHGLLATGGDDALAIISTGRGKEMIYALGGTLPGGARLNAVYGDRVILERGASLETLRLPKDKQTGFSLEQSDEGEADLSPPTQLSADEELGRSLQSYREKALKDPAQLISLLQAEPVSENDRFIGFRLNPGSDAPLFSQLGLEPGDIVTGINGMALERPEQGINAMRRLINANEINLTINRNGVEITIQQSIGQ